MEKSVSIKTDKLFFCNYCERSWSRNRDFIRHLGTLKHEKKRQEVEKMPQSDVQPNTQHIEKNMRTIYCCDVCHFSTEDKKESCEHKNNETTLECEILIKYVCCKCDKY